MPGLKSRLTAAGYGLGWSVLCRVPETWSAAAFQRAADLAWRRQGPRVRVLEGNLRRVLGPDAPGAELRAVSRAAMRSYARYWLEVFRLPVMDRDAMIARTDAEGEIDTLFAHLAAGRGVVAALPHMGNWDQAGAWVVAKGAGSFSTVMERLEPEDLYERFVGFRESLGMEVLPATGGDSPFGVLARRLRAGKLVALPCDRDVTGRGIEVDFFGEQTLMMAGPAALAIQTGAALMPVTLWYAGPRWGIHIHEEIPVPADGDRSSKTVAMTQQVAAAFERGIREHPSDWHMLQPVFLSDLDPERLARARARNGRPGNGGAATGGSAAAGP
ncbi:MAG: phosphatidylinositol mannoside acyltransferase [Streptosporangiaceae bacterium]